MKSFGVFCTCVAFFAVFTHGACPPGWIPFGEKCYFFSNTTLTFADSGSMCRMFNSKLAEPKTKAENSFLDLYVKQNIGSRSDGVWIGVTDIFVQDSYVYVSSLDKVYYFDWGVGEPHSDTTTQDEDCVIISTYRNEKWADVTCQQRFHFVCERLMGEDGAVIVG